MGGVAPDLGTLLFDFCHFYGQTLNLREVRNLNVNTERREGREEEREREREEEEEKRRRREGERWTGRVRR